MCNRKNYIPEWISLSKITERKLPDYVLGDNTAFNISAMLIEEKNPIVNALTIWDFCCLIHRVLLYDKILIAPDTKFLYGSLAEILKNRVYQFSVSDNEFDTIMEQTSKDVKNEDLKSIFLSIFDLPENRRILNEYRRLDVEARLDKETGHSYPNSTPSMDFMLNAFGGLSKIHDQEKLEGYQKNYPGLLLFGNIYLKACTDRKIPYDCHSFKMPLIAKKISMASYFARQQIENVGESFSKEIWTKFHHPIYEPQINDYLRMPSPVMALLEQCTHKEEIIDNLKMLIREFAGVRKCIKKMNKLAKIGD